MACNVVTFTAADGKSQKFPLKFLIDKKAVIASQVNGAPLTESFGSVNQLWIPGLPAKYFMRDITSIVFTEEEELPKIDEFVDDGHDYTNRPNISVRGEYLGYTGSPLTFEGYADDYDKAIRAVEISLDDGETWTVCDTSDATAERWVWWHFTWTPGTPGSYILKARAVNEDGKVSPLPAECAFEVL